MDPITLVFLVLAFVFFLLGVLIEGGDIGALIAIPSFMIVVLPAICAGLSGFLKSDLGAVLAGVKESLFGKTEPPGAAIEELVVLAERARREGLLALEEASRKIENPFLKQGIELAVDGTDPEELRDILETEIASRKSRDKIGVKFFTDVGGFAPTVGILGAVVGLINVMQKLDDPVAAGHGIAVAFTATLYGVGIANLVALPLANKLKRLSEVRVHHMELLLEGIISIQGGANPRVIEQKLLAYLPEKDRESARRDAA